MFSSEQIDFIQSEFQSLNSIYLNSAYLGPLPKSGQVKVKAALEKEADPSGFAYENWKDVAEVTRESTAKLLKVSPAHLAHHTSVAEVISLMSLSLPLQSSDQVLIMKGDYPSNVLPWMRNQKRRGYDIQMENEEVFFDIEKFKKVLNPNIKVINISHVMFNKGDHLPVYEICQIAKENNIIVALDGTQFFGSQEISDGLLELVDVYAFATYKWLLGPYGHAFAYYSEDYINKIEPVIGNWLTSPNSKNTNDLLNYTLDLCEGAKRYDRGQTSNMLVLAGLEGALDVISKVGLDKIGQHNIQLKNAFVERLNKEKFKMITQLPGSSIVCLKTKDDPLMLERSLKEKNIDVSVREGNLRVSFHLMNSLDDLEVLLSALN